MKKLTLLGGALLSMLLLSGCEVTPYGGSYVGVQGEYPSTYYGQTYSYPVYPDYGYGYRAWGPYDRDHYWDRDRHWEHERREHHEHDRDDWR